MVYLVDDDIDDLELVQEALHSNSYKGPVNALLNGQMLLEQLNDTNARKPGVIILDLNMPYVDGFTALTEIRKDPQLKSIPVIVLTASSRKEDEVRCFDLGCNFFFNKPVNIDEYRHLVAMVKSILSKVN
jgi:CheY-like chemotaxis protein